MLIPWIKPRTLNNDPIEIKKGEIIKFGNNNQIKDVIQLSNHIPKIINKIKHFSLSDGTYQFKFISFKNNVLIGKSLQSFISGPKKGLNVPLSIYDDSIQEKKYLSFLKKIDKLKFDCIGLSFIQNAKIINILKKNILKNYLSQKLKIIWVSKIEKK